MEEEIEIRDNFNQDILDRAPGWLMNWGVIVVILGIISLVTLAAIIPYNQTIRFTVTLGNEAATYVVAPLSGTILVNKLAAKPTVNKGDTLLVMSTAGPSMSYVIAGCSGFTVYPNKSVINASRVTAGDTLIKILPIINTKKKVTAVGYYDQLIPQDRLQTSASTINITTATGKTMAIKSRIIYTSLVPEEGKGYTVVIEPDSINITRLAPVYHGMQATAAITLKKRSVIQWILD